MILSRSRRALRALPLLLVLVVPAACTLQVGGGGKPSALRDYVGVNGLLADPAATRHRPSVEVTVHRLWAARLAGVPVQHVPSTSMVDGLLKQQDEPVRRDLEIRWATYSGDTARVGRSVAALATQCRRADAPDDCDAVVRSVWSFLTVSRSPALGTFHTAFPGVRPPACPASATTVGDQFGSVLCGRAVRDADAFDRALPAVLDGDGLVVDSRTLFAATAVAKAGGLDSDTLRSAVRDAVGRSQVEGVFFDETPAQGTLLTSWALLHLARSDRGGLDTDALVAAVRREPTDGAADRVVLSRAGLALLGSSPLPTRGGPLPLRDPDGPYNPFIALAARDAGDAQLVSVEFTAAEARRTPERLASWIITRRIVEGRPVAVTAADLRMLDDLAGDDAATPVRALLRDAALAASGRAGTPTTVSLGCEGAGWLVSVAGECDIRSSLLVALRDEFSAPQGAA